MTPPRLSVLGVAFALTALAGAARAVPAHEPDDMTLGSPKAPVTVIEYASVGCPHCAAWSNQVFPTIQSQYIATGKARLVVREELTGDGLGDVAQHAGGRRAGQIHAVLPVIDRVDHREVFRGTGAARQHEADGGDITVAGQFLAHHEARLASAMYGDWMVGKTG